MARKPADSTTNDTITEAKTRTRKQYALLYKDGEDGDWQEVAIFNSINDAKAGATAIRQAAEKNDWDISDWKFTTRVISGQSEEF